MWLCVCPYIQSARKLIYLTFFYYFRHIIGYPREWIQGNENAKSYIRHWINNSNGSERGIAHFWSCLSWGAGTIFCFNTDSHPNFNIQLEWHDKKKKKKKSDMTIKLKINYERERLLSFEIRFGVYYSSLRLVILSV